MLPASLPACLPTLPLPATPCHSPFNATSDRPNPPCPQAQLLLAALTIVTSVLRPGGVFVAKIFRGGAGRAGRGGGGRVQRVPAREAALYRACTAQQCLVPYRQAALCSSSWFRGQQRVMPGSPCPMPA